MGMPAAIRRRWTRDEVLALIEANPLHTPRYELVDGELIVTPSPNAAHQRAVLELAVALRAWLLETGVGQVYVSPFDVELESGTTVGPDVFVVPPGEAERLRTQMPARRLLLAVEVISPGSARGDRGTKRELYQRHVGSYWIVDVDAELVEQWRPGDDRPEILRAALRWHPSGASAPFTLDLSSYFAGIRGGH
jgi:Uma2 family endonuclease